MDKQVIKNRFGKPIGFLDDCGQRVNAISYAHGLVGFYSKTANITYDSNCQIYCYGSNALAALLLAAGD